MQKSRGVCWRNRRSCGRKAHTFFWTACAIWLIMTLWITTPAQAAVTTYEKDMSVDRTIGRSCVRIPIRLTCTYGKSGSASGSVMELSPYKPMVAGHGGALPKTLRVSFVTGGYPIAHKVGVYEKAKVPDDAVASAPEIAKGWTYGQMKDSRDFVMKVKVQYFTKDGGSYKSGWSKTLSSWKNKNGAEFNLRQLARPQGPGAKDSMKLFIKWRLRDGKTTHTTSVRLYITERMPYGDTLVL